VKRLSSIFQFIVGFLLGLLILAGGTTALAYVFFSKMTANPPKPVFAEEEKENPTAKTPTPQASPDQKAVAEAPETESESATQEEVLPPGAYRAKVTWSEGLSIRSEPSREAERIGGVGYNGELIVLQESQDKQWQKVRLSEGTLEGWIKTGNVEKIEE
jgi:hypothetical protein